MKNIIRNILLLTACYNKTTPSPMFKNTKMNVRTPIVSAVFSMAVALMIHSTVTIKANAEILLLQMLGESQVIGDLNDAENIYETGIDFAELESTLGRTDVAIVEVLTGTGDGDSENIGEEFVCFELSLVDPETGIYLGNGVDCLRPENGTLPGDDNFQVTAVSILALEGGSIVNVGRTSVASFAAGFGDGPVDNQDGPPATHITGSIPGPHEAAENRSIIAGTGVFEGVVGTGRVSGAVALDESVWFNCMWVLDLWTNPGTKASAKRSGNRR
jgi:hypothetical protein